MKYNAENFINKLIAHEGLRLQVYQDTLGIDTIGIGRNLEDRGITKEEMDWMDIPNMDAIYEYGITEADAMYLAQNDVQIVEEELVRSHPCVEELDAVRQLVLVDMAFNMGVPRLSKFKKMWAAIHENKFDVAAKEMLDSRWANQVKSRSTKLAHAMHHGEFNG
jgi:lysozyme|tara:strand:- start:1570 stop:2061 length:492 start_codon:yes stop_codon:yes gene_type:complete